MSCVLCMSLWIGCEGNLTHIMTLINRLIGKKHLQELSDTLNKMNLRSSLCGQDVFCDSTVEKPCQKIFLWLQKKQFEAKNGKTQ